MKIAYRLFWYPRISETFIFDEVDWLVKSGHEVLSVVSKPVPGVADPTPQVPVVEAYDQNQVVNAVTKFGARHIHTHFGRFAFKEKIALLAEQCRCSYSITIHMSEIWGDGALSRDQWKSLWNSSLCRGIVAISYTHREHMLRLGVPDDKIVVIPNSVGEIRETLGSRTQQPRVLSVGRLVPMKGHDILIRAFEEVRQVFPKSTLTIIGGGEGKYADELYTLAKNTDGVELLGEQPRSRVYEEFQNSTIFALACRPTPATWDKPGRCDGLPTVLLEAMSCGIPVATCPVGAIDELVQHDERGLLSSVGAPGALAANIVRLLGDVKLRERLATNAKRYTVRVHNRDINLPRLARLFSQPIHGR